MSVEIYLETITDKVLDKARENGLQNNGQIEQPLLAAASVALTFQQIQKMHSARRIGDESYQRLVSSCMDAVALSSWQYFQDEPVFNRLGLLNADQWIVGGLDAKLLSLMFERATFKEDSNRVIGATKDEIDAYLYGDNSSLRGVDNTINKVRRVLGFKKFININYESMDGRYRAEYVDESLNIRPPKVEKVIKDENTLVNRERVALGSVIASNEGSNIARRMLSKDQVDIVVSLGNGLWRDVDDATRAFLKSGGSPEVLEEWRQNRVAALLAVRYSSMNGKKLDVPSELLNLPINYLDALLTHLDFDVTTLPKIDEPDSRSDEVRATREKFKAEAIERDNARVGVLSPVLVRPRVKVEVVPQVIDESENAKAFREVAGKLKDKNFTVNMAELVIDLLERGESHYTVEKAYFYWGISREMLDKVTDRNIAALANNSPVSFAEIIRGRFVKNFSDNFVRRMRMSVKKEADYIADLRRVEDGLARLFRKVEFNEDKLRAAILSIPYKSPGKPDERLLFSFL